MLKASDAIGIEVESLEHGQFPNEKTLSSTKVIHSPRPSMITLTQFDRVAPVHFSVVDAVTRMPLKATNNSSASKGIRATRSTSAPGKSESASSKETISNLKMELQKVLSSYNSLVREVKESRKDWNRQKEQLLQENKNLKVRVSVLQSYRKQHALDFRESKKQVRNSSQHSLSPIKKNLEASQDPRLRRNVLSHTDVHELLKLTSTGNISESLKNSLRTILASNSSTLVVDGPSVLNSYEVDKHNECPRIQSRREQSLINSLVLKETKCHILKKERDTLRDTVKVRTSV